MNADAPWAFYVPEPERVIVHAGLQPILSLSLDEAAMLAADLLAAVAARRRPASEIADER